MLKQGISNDDQFFWLIKTYQGVSYKPCPRSFELCTKHRIKVDQSLMSGSYPNDGPSISKRPGLVQVDSPLPNSEEINGKYK